MILLFRSRALYVLLPCSDLQYISSTSLSLLSHKQTYACILTRQHNNFNTKKTIINNKTDSCTTHHLQWPRRALKIHTRKQEMKQIKNNNNNPKICTTQSIPKHCLCCIPSWDLPLFERSECQQCKSCQCHGPRSNSLSLYRECRCNGVLKIRFKLLLGISRIFREIKLRYYMWAELGSVPLLLKWKLKNENSSIMEQ